MGDIHSVMNNSSQIGLSAPVKQLPPTVPCQRFRGLRPFLVDTPEVGLAN
jgi:hypothetical protein